MTNQEQIAEMQKVICEHCGYENIENFPCKKERNKCAGYQISELFYTAGYRKEDEIRKETAKEILNAVDNESNEQTISITNYLRKKYGVEV